MPVSLEAILEFPGNTQIAPSLIGFPTLIPFGTSFALAKLGTLPSCLCFERLRGHVGSMLSLVPLSEIRFGSKCVEARSKRWAGRNQVSTRQSFLAWLSTWLTRSLLAIFGLFVRCACTAGGVLGVCCCPAGSWRLGLASQLPCGCCSPPHSFPWMVRAAFRPCQ